MAVVIRGSKRGSERKLNEQRGQMGVCMHAPPTLGGIGGPVRSAGDGVCRRCGLGCVWLFGQVEDVSVMTWISSTDMKSKQGHREPRTFKGLLFFL